MPSKPPAPQVKCPACGRPQVPGEGQTMFWCGHCPAYFDRDGDDDGGDYFTDPTKRAELADERRAQPKRRR